MTQDQVKDLFEYRDGHLYWRESGKGRPADLKAGTQHHDGRTFVNVNYKRQALHRLIFLYHHGYLPELVDHIDNDNTNNRIENLREATKSQNAMNSKIEARNKSGFKNVSWSKQANKWLVQIKNNGRAKHIGLFDDLELADLTAQEARDINHKQFARNK